MLESQVLDQAHGLQAWELHPPTRVLPVVNTGPSTRSFELLWRLEQSFRTLALPVVVLEGVRGLRPHDATAGYRAVMRRWLAGVPGGSVVLLHAPLEALTVLLGDSEARPLVALDDTPPGLVEAYNAVKVLHQAAALEPIVMALQAMPAHEPTAGPDRLSNAVQSLRSTCEQQLAWVPLAWSLEYHFSGTGMRDGAAALSSRLKLLDSALILDDLETRSYDDKRDQRSPIRAEQILGAPDVQRQRYA